MKLKKKQQEFIKQAYGEVCNDWKVRIKEAFPDLFENELEVGKWYKTSAGHLVCITRITGVRVYAYGFGAYSHEKGQWIDDLKWSDYTPFRWSLATEQEIEKALIKEAKKRGYNQNNFNSLIPNGDINFDGWYYKESQNRLYTADIGCGGKVVFEHGQWAEIIETITKEEAEKQLGKKIID